MATKTTTKRKGTSTARKDGVGDDALRRLQASIDAAEVALKDLRREMGRGSRDLLADLDRTLKDARKNARRAGRAMVRDLEQVQKAAAGQQKSRRTTARKRTQTAARG